MAQIPACAVIPAVSSSRALLPLLLLGLLLALAAALAWQLPADPGLARDILWQLRLPRVGLAAVAGAALGLAGLLLQDLFRNPLVEPGLLGVSAGAGLAAVLALAAGVTGAWLLPALAFAGALGALALVLVLGNRLGRSSATLLLVGVAINALVAALVQLLLSLGDNNLLRSASFWLMGSFAQADGRLLLPAAAILLLVGLRAHARAAALDLWQLGDGEAGHLGLDVPAFRRELALLGSLLVAITVAQAGGIGFIGLLAPHMARRLGAVLHRQLLPASLLLGGLLAVLADLLARVLIAPLELPVGVLTALLGAPAFLLLFLRGQRA